MREISPHILRAIKSGPIPELRDWRSIAKKHPKEPWLLTPGEQVCAFIERTMCVPEGNLAGQPFELLEWQEVLIQAMFRPDGTRALKVICSVGRKSGKTTLAAAILLAMMFGSIYLAKDEKRPLLRRLCRVNSAALTRDQAALLWTAADKICQMSPALHGKYRSVASGKKLTATTTGIEYRSLSADTSGGRTMGLSPALLIGDEWGAIRSPTSDYVDALQSAQGAFDDAIFMVISTQAPSDGALLSRWIDDATKHPDDDVVVHLYSADPTLALDDPEAWRQACPSLDGFRPSRDIEAAAAEAIRNPAQSASFENLILNRRVSLQNLFISAQEWRETADPIDRSIFSDGRPVFSGIDLSAKTDLTAVVLAAEADDGRVHLWPLCFTPSDTLEERARKDRAPYPAWVRSGELIATAGPVVDYRQVVDFMVEFLDKHGIELTCVGFDRWNFQHFRPIAEAAGFASNADWQAIGQGYRWFSPRLASFKARIMKREICHENHPVLTMAAGLAVAESDANGNMLLRKDKSFHRIDPLQAAVMAVSMLDDSEASGATVRSYLDDGSPILWLG